MTYEDELINPDELKVGEVFKMRLLKHFASDHKCALIDLESRDNIQMFNDEVKYEVKQIIEDCSLWIVQDGCCWKDFKKIIVIEKTA